MTFNDPPKKHGVPNFETTIEFGCMTSSKSCPGFPCPSQVLQLRIFYGAKPWQHRNFWTELLLFRGIIVYRFDLIYAQEGGWWKRSRKVMCAEILPDSFLSHSNISNHIFLNPFSIAGLWHQVGDPTLPNPFGICRHSQSTFEATASCRLACGSCCRTCERQCPLTSGFASSIRM